ncbi:MAG: transcriptional repressor LexA, partial [Bacilli bacterium]|nr:transcriptional repressor LexA [Bacilli bacterium]
MLNSDLTKKQEEVLVFVKKYIVQNGYPPSVREICTGLNLSSPATVHTHLKQLEIKGAIKKTASKFRTIEVVGENEFVPKDEDVVKVPLLGKITAGSPIEAIENPDDFFALPASLIPKRETIFTLKVEGDSMINVGIHDSDVVIVQKQKVARNGDIVVAMNEENEVTLKTFYKEKDHIRLQP